MNNNVVYIAGKAPLTQHQDECRICVCRIGSGFCGEPGLEAGWNLFSKLETEKADQVYDGVVKALKEGGARYDAQRNIWTIPLVEADKLMTSQAASLEIPLNGYARVC